MKVVMVDDSASDRMLCRILLAEATGPQLSFYEEDTAQNGLDACRRIEPDCILLDYRLPDMSGLDFLTELGASRSAVVMLTGLSDEGVAREAIQAGAQDYLVKNGITRESLRLAVQNSIQKVRFTRALEAERDRLAQSLAEKEVLLREVHHRVKNNLQIIASLLRLQASHSGDRALAEALRDSQQRVESMAMLHEQLYESADLREIDLATHASQVLKNLLHAYADDPGRIVGEVRMPPCPINMDQAIPVGLILNELVSNALKHAFPGERPGNLRICGDAQPDSVTLSVEDDGIGLPPAAAPEKPKSLGLQIVRILTKQLKGSLEVGREGGTSFRLSFPRR